MSRLHLPTQLTSAPFNYPAALRFTEDGDQDQMGQVIDSGTLAGVYRKHYRPNYGVFDEDRYFRASNANTIFEMGEPTLGVSVCEDIWYPSGPPVILLWFAHTRRS